MAVETGTATSVSDLLNRLRLFLTTNSTLVGLGQHWTQLAWNSGAGELFLRAPGTSGTENIYVNFKSYSDVPGDIYALICRGAIGYDSQLNFDNQPQTSVACYMSTWDTTTPYWFIANGRRVIVIAKASTTYHALYAGKFLPFGTPSQYPSPIYIGAEFFSAVRYSSTSNLFRHFYDPGDGCKVLRPDLGWYTVQNNDVNGAATYSIVMHPMRGASSGDSIRSTFDALRENIDGTYPLFPCTIMESTPTQESLGELDGVYITSGYSNGSEDTITVSGDTYLVVKNIFRTGVGNAAAIKLV